MSKAAQDINFSPLTVFLGIISGTVIAIAFGLCVVCLIFWILRNEEPRLLAEVNSLAISTGIFLVLSVFASFSFIASLKRYPWRYVPMAALALSLFLTGRYYWPV